MLSRRYCLLLLALALPALAIAGCGGDRPDLGTVHGVVTVDGQPVEGAEIRFEPADASSRGAWGISGPDGRYQLFYIRDIKGAPVGECTVRITTATEGRGEMLPPTYHVQSTLKRTVEPGDNEINFNLKTNP